MSGRVREGRGGENGSFPAGLTGSGAGIMVRATGARGAARQVPGSCPRVG